MSAPIRIGFAGLGRMGAPMAARLARAGFQLAVWNRTAEKAQAFARESGARVATSPSALAETSDVVIAMVADDAASQALHLGPGGLAEAASGRLFVEMSTISPDHVRRLGAALAARGGALIDAPVSGSVDAARAGSLAIMAGGDPKDVERARPALDAMGRVVLETGPLGTGATMKIVVNSLIHGLNQTLAEALALAESAGIATRDAFAVIENSAAAAPMLGYRKPLYLEPQAHPVAFALDLALKDMGLALALGEAGGVAMPQARVTRAVLEQASAAGLGGEDMAAVVPFMRRLGRSS
ncbi:NAD(P)-dependent oxidoreductase [Salinarimonas sp. NSM]|uniref:NAD(P)-dependent oxidoreductase n=1 Tax=Salinarimonas sp. NSM TaxID=3458003 RepID=UPI004036D410